jgi:hypothetical protein
MYKSGLRGRADCVVRCATRQALRKECPFEGRNSPAGMKVCACDYSPSVHQVSLHGCLRSLTSEIRSPVDSYRCGYSTRRDADDLVPRLRGFRIEDVDTEVVGRSQRAPES